MSRGKWNATQICPVCGKNISRRGFAWRKHEATHPELVRQRRRNEAIFKEAMRIARA